MGLALAKSALFELICCCTCGVDFYIPTLLEQNLRKTKDSFYCPNGHPQAYMESAADRLRRALKSAENRVMEANKLRWKAELKLKRVKNGVCPCCKCLIL